MSALPRTVMIMLEPVCCCVCGMWFGLDSTFRQRAGDDSDVWFYCPQGHKQHFTVSKVTKLERELELKARSLQIAREQRDHQERRARTYRGHLTRIRRRVGNGVCPCCKRTFKQLASHMQRQHPEYGQPVEVGIVSRKA